MSPPHVLGARPPIGSGEHFRLLIRGGCPDVAFFLLGQAEGSQSPPGIRGGNVCLQVTAEADILNQNWGLLFTPEDRWLRENTPPH